MSIQFVPLEDIEANPYRKIDTYTMSESKIESLIQSYRNTGFWQGSIQARPHPTRAGKYEVAYGHHRVEAARREKLGAIGLVVNDRSNAQMLKMMADENRAEFRADAMVAVETIAAVVEAYDRGDVELEPIDPKDRSEKFALPGGNANRKYTLGTVARFLGWIKPSDGQANNQCRHAFDTYRELASTKEALDSIPSAKRSEVAVETVVTAARAARAAGKKANLTPSQIRLAEQKAAQGAAKEVREQTGFKAHNTAVKIGRAAAAEGAKRKTAPPPVGIYIHKLIRECDTLDPYQQILAQCRRLIPFIDDLDATQTRKLASALEGMLTRSARGVKHVADALRANKPTKLREALEA